MSKPENQKRKKSEELYGQVQRALTTEPVQPLVKKKEPAGSKGTPAAAPTTSGAVAPSAGQAPTPGPGAVDTPGADSSILRIPRLGPTYGGVNSLAGAPTERQRLLNRQRRLNDILPRTSMPGKERTVQDATNQLDVAKLDQERRELPGNDIKRRVDRFYSSQFFERGDDWLHSPTGRFADTKAAQVTGAVLDGNSYFARIEELRRAFRAGLGDPTLARGSQARAQADWDAKRLAWRERLAAEKARDDASYEFIKQRGAESRRRAALRDVPVDVNLDMKGGQAFGSFPVGGDGRHYRRPMGTDKLALIAKALGY